MNNACRHLSIRFLESGDVEYDFFRHQSKYILNKYIIEWDSNQVEITGGQNLHADNFRKTITPQGYILLKWDKVYEDASLDSGRGVSYIKRNYLYKTSSDPPLWKYKENFKIKPSLSLWLHTPFEKINAINKKSFAKFTSIDGTVKFYSPRDMSDIVFHKTGILQVDWTLELLRKAKNIW